jgi:hypothetical protein
MSQKPRQSDPDAALAASLRRGRPAILADAYARAQSCDDRVAKALYLAFKAEVERHPEMSSDEMFLAVAQLASELLFAVGVAEGLAERNMRTTELIVLAGDMAMLRAEEFNAAPRH